MRAISIFVGTPLFVVMVCLIGCSEENPDVLNSTFFEDGAVASSELAPGIPYIVYPWNNTGNVSIEPMLQWTCDDPDSDSENLRYNLYFGTDSPPSRIVSGLETSQYQMQGLAYSTTYFWGIIAYDESNNSTAGYTNVFTTMSEPNSSPTTPSNQSPADSAVGIAIDLQLSWSVSDPESDPLKYALHFGTRSSPPLVDSNIQVQYYNPGRLESLMDYFWCVEASDGHGNSITGPTWTFQTTLGGTIAFVSNRSGSSGLYRMNAAGALQQLWLNTGATIYDPTWSRDGSKLAFTSYVDGSWEIFTVLANGSGIQRITNNSVRDGDPRWSPDGARLTFTRDMGTYNDQIFAINVDGTGETNLSNNSHNDHWSTWSPDGATIAFIRSFGDIWLMDANGGNQRKLAESYSLAFSEVDWSPDGTKLLTYRGPNENRDIYLLDADGTHSTKLTTDPADDLWPCWSPDGEFIAWVSRRDGDNEIYIMRADGSDKTNISNSPSSSEIQPSWKR